ncbi:U2 small nuclear ribonucleoprotein A' [Glycine soja]|uniref:U2 small nuclear ribonucleoprotein A n=1 Tax=Glycine soja TaxID=3848 RepID=A0A0B2RR34_GLYSO|nr:U2 small nuclear ribonucleoprotein A' [Glycine soja]
MQIPPSNTTDHSRQLLARKKTLMEKKTKRFESSFPASHWKAAKSPFSTIYLFLLYSEWVEVMVRLTADLIWKSPHFFNTIKERELDLRGNKIAVIENLGATEDQFDTIDLSDNEIVKLENVPYLNRLGTMLINNNRITRINPNIGEFLPNLHTLVLTNNRIVNLVEIDPLASLPKLHFLSLLDNNITKKPNYRLYVINNLKSLRVLDFKKVKNKERLEAKNLFASKEVIEEIQRTPAKTFSTGETPNVSEAIEEQQTPKVVAPTPEQIIAIKAAIVNSQTLEEVARLEKALKSGQLPADLKSLSDNIMLDNVDEKHEDMIHDDRSQADGKSNDTQEQRNTDSASMEQKLSIVL